MTKPAIHIRHPSQKAGLCQLESGLIADRQEIRSDHDPPINSVNIAITKAATFPAARSTYRDFASRQPSNFGNRRPDDRGGLHGPLGTVRSPKTASDRIARGRFDQSANSSLNAHEKGLPKTIGSQKPKALSAHPRSGCPSPGCFRPPEAACSTKPLKHADLMRYP